MLLSMFAVTALTAEAADSDILNIKIANVTKKYKDVGTLLDLINSKRYSKGLSQLVMDKDLYEQAMVRAAELPLLNVDTNLMDETYSYRWAEVDGCFYNYYGEAVLITDSSIDNIVNELFNNYANTVAAEAVDEIGIGIVTINDDPETEYICVRTTNEKTNFDERITAVSSSVYSKADEKTTVSTKAYAGNLRLSTPYDNGDYTIKCGETEQLYFKASELYGGNTYAYIIPDSVTSSSWSVFNTAAGGKVIAKTPGQANITLKIAGDNYKSYTKTVKLTSLGRGLGDCTIDEILPQIYTGDYIVPDIVVRDASGAPLTEGSDYVVELQDNLNPGRAHIIITGINDYENTQTEIDFEIIELLEDLETELSASKTRFVVDEEIVLTADTVGGAAPYTYTFITDDRRVLYEGSDNTVEFKADEPDTGVFYVYVTDSTGLKAVDELAYTVENKLNVYAEASEYETYTGTEIDISPAYDSGYYPVDFSGEYTFEGKTVKCDVNENGQFVFTPDKAGTYQFKIIGTDCEGYTSESELSVEVFDRIKNTSTISASEVTLGKTVTVKGAAEGGIGSSYFTYYYKKSTSAAWTNAGSGESAEINFGSAAVYKVKAVAEDGYNSSDTKIFTVNVNKPGALANNSTVSSEKVYIGDKLTLNAAASGGEKPYSYSFCYKKSSSTVWQKIGNGYDTESSVQIGFASAADYIVKISVKDADGKIVDKTFNITSAKAEPLSNETVIRTNAASAENVTVGEKLTFVGMASGGKGGYTYTFFYKKSASPAWTALQTSGETPDTAEFAPAMEAEYKLKAVVTDSTGSKAEKVFTVKAQKAAELKNTSVISTNSTSADSIFLGDEITIRASAEGGTGSYSYTYFYKKSTSAAWTAIQPSAAAYGLAYLKPAAAAEYKIKTVVKDGAGKTAEKIFTVTVNKSVTTLTNTSVISAQEITKGEKVIINASAAGGTAPYTAAYYYKKSTSQAWQPLSPSNDDENTAVFDAVSKTEYNIRVEITDAAGSKSVKTFTVKVS